jgi:eukaryotic-like serine/threonine-protein kinase
LRQLRSANRRQAAGPRDIAQDSPRARDGLRFAVLSPVIGSQRRIDAGPAIGTTLNGKWRIDAQIGRGGMATVYAVTHRYGYRAAIKVLSPAVAADPEIRQRFLREGYISNAVGHPAAVQVLDDDVWNETVFLVMELLEGETLEARRRRLGGRLQFAEVLASAETLLDVLAVAHGRGIVHRDVKPDNVFMTSSGATRVLDFGIAQVRHLGAMTSAGTVMGTLDFMSPEQAVGTSEDVDARTDVWAAGATMFHLLSGALVHEAATPRERLLLAASRAPRSLAEAAPFVPREIVAVVDRALAFDKADRWPDAHSMRFALRLASRGASERRAVAAGLSSERTMVMADDDERTLALPTRARGPGSEPTLLAAQAPPSAPDAAPRVVTGGSGSQAPVELPRYAPEPIELPMRSGRRSYAVAALLVAAVLALLGGRRLLAAPGQAATPTSAGVPAAAPIAASAEPAIPEPAAFAPTPARAPAVHALAPHAFPRPRGPHRGVVAPSADAGDAPIPVPEGDDVPETRDDAPAVVNTADAAAAQGA